MFYLTMHSTHFNDGYMATDHSDSKRKSAAATWVTLFSMSGMAYCMHHSTDRIAHTTVFVKPVVEHWLQREMSTHDGIDPTTTAP